MPNNELVAATSANPAAIDQRAVLAALNMNPADPKVQALVMVCQKYGMDMLLKHVVLIQGSMYVTRDGLLHVAHSSGQFDGLQVEYLGMDSDNRHFVARCTVHRKDMKFPFTMQGRYPAGERMAAKFGPEMAEKVATCRALRMAFDVSLCSREETWDNEDATEIPPSQHQLPTPKQVEAAPPMPRPALPPQPTAAKAPNPTIEAMKQYARAAEANGRSVSTNGVPSKRMMSDLFVEQTGINASEATSDDWIRAAVELPDFLRDAQPVQDTQFTEEPASTPAPAQAQGSYKNTFPTPTTPPLPTNEPGFDDPFAEEDAKPTPYASASSDRGAY